MATLGRRGGMGAWRSSALDDLSHPRRLLDQTLVMPARGKVLIKKPDTEETLPGGSIIIPEKARESFAANQFQIVEVGEDERCEWPEDCGLETHRFTPKDCFHPIDPRVKAGAWVVCRPRSLVDAGEGLYLVKQGDVLAVFTQPQDSA